MLGPDREEINRMIQQAVSAAYAQIGGIIGVQQNHTIATLPNTTTNVTAGVTSLGTVPMTAKGPGNFRYTVVGTFQSTSTTPLSIASVVTFRLNGTNTISIIPGLGTGLVATPNFTSIPSVGQFSFIIELAQAAALASNTSIWKTPLPGQTVSADIGLAASAGSFNAFAQLTTASAEEIF